MQQLGIDPPPRADLTDWRSWFGWFQRLRQAIPKTETYTATINPVAVAANSTAEQTFTVTGLATTDIVTVNKPTHTSGLGIVNARVSATDTLAITFVNLTGSPINPPEEAYLIKTTRR